MHSGMGCKVHWLLVCSTAVLFAACSVFSRAKGGARPEAHVVTVDNNVCKRLKEKVVVYGVFVDSKVGGVWSTHDIRSTMDSIRVATDWIMQQAGKKGVDLNILVASHDKGGVVPVRSELPRSGLGGMLRGVSPASTLDRWADKACRQVQSAFPRDTSRITLTKHGPKDRERLIAALRDRYQTDNVALFLFVNNYFGSETSVALHTGSNTSIEYATVAFKRPAVIVHEFLHLFGALDLYITPFDDSKSAERRKQFAMERFPKEVMAFPFRGLDSLEIGTLTEYLIGWRRELLPEDEALLTGGKIRLAKY
jgi:hypothetical protein